MSIKMHCWHSGGGRGILWVRISIGSWMDIWKYSLNFFLRTGYAPDYSDLDELFADLIVGTGHGTVSRKRTVA